MSTHPSPQELMALLGHYPVSPDILDRLALYIQEADDVELYRINPRRLAAQLDMTVPMTLELMAYAVQAGVFELNWDVRCPHCGGKRTFPTLNEGRGQEFCAKCRVHFDVHLDHEVLVTFTVHPTIRNVGELSPLPEQYPPTLGIELLNVQAFRDLFSDQVLPPEESLKVTQMVFLFTDLLGSTSMYAREGDPRAFGRVRDHFDVLFEAAVLNNGVTIKTIGDAVMCSFLSPIDAFQAAVDMYEGVEALNGRLGLLTKDMLSIRIGVHMGPCIAVTLNDRLDYFGETVNVASRVSHLSRGNDLILTPQVAEDRDVQRVIPQHGVLTRFEAALHGYDRHFELYRLAFHAVRLVHLDIGADH